MTKNFVQLSYDDFDFLILENYVVASIFVELRENQILQDSFVQNFFVDFNNESIFCFNFSAILKYFNVFSSGKEQVQNDKIFCNVLILNSNEFTNLPKCYKNNKYFGIILSTPPMVKNFLLDSFSIIKGNFGKYLSSMGILATRFIDDEFKKAQYFVDLDKLLKKEWSFIQ